MDNLPRFKFTLQSLLILLGCAFFVFSCNSHRSKNKKAKTLTFSEEAFSKRLEAIMPPVDTIKKGSIANLDYNLKYTYQLNDHAPVWLLSTSYTPSQGAHDFIAELEDIWKDGINPEKYHISEIKKAMKKLGGKETTVNDALAFDTLVTKCYLMAAKDLLLGEINPKKVDSLWFHANDSVWLAPEILAGMKEKYIPISNFRSTFPTYLMLQDEYKRYHDLLADSALHTAINSIEITTDPDSSLVANAANIISKEMPWAVPVVNDSEDESSKMYSSFQYYSGLKTTGALDTNTLKRLAVHPDSIMQVLGANMERIRWMQQRFGDLYVLVNIPLMELFLRRQGGDSMHMRVVVGKSARQTPTLYALMANIVINPRWEVPPTILKQDVLPGLQKSGKKYLAKKGLKVYDKDGKAVNAGLVTAGNFRRYNYQQAPGNDNALGFVKFNLPNPFDIYLHDTPHRGDFVKRDRALSSGCIRVQQPREMAIYILNELENRKFSRGKLDSVIATHKTQWQVLKTKIPVHITYLTAFEDTTNSHIRLLNDIYHRNDKLISKLYN